MTDADGKPNYENLYNVDNVKTLISQNVKKKIPLSSKIDYPKFHKFLN